MLHVVLDLVGRDPTALQLFMQVRTCTPGLTFYLCIFEISLQHALERLQAFKTVEMVGLLIGALRDTDKVVQAGALAVCASMAPEAEFRGEVCSKSLLACDSATFFA
jgi:hypothetical protein